MEIGVDRQRKGSNARLEAELGRKKSSLRRKRWRWREALSGYLFILPAILGFLIFVLYPLVASAYYALTRWDGVTSSVFVVLKNFSYIFTQDPSFLPTLRATGLFALLSVPSSLIVGLLLAVLLNRKLPGIKIFRTTLYLPVLWMITLVLKSSNDIYKLPSEFLPKEFHCGRCYHAMELLYGHQSALYTSSKIIGRWTLHIV